jgi:acetyltransferase-like isoleucine patch superfamily enzyme
MGWIGPRATLAPGVTLEHAIVGAGAVVRGEGALERCVVWPGATAVAPLKDAIVAGHEVIHVV